MLRLSRFLQVWKDFEVKHGNEDTLREMLRIKRSVQAVYNTQVCMVLRFEKSKIFVIC